jgi:hypothetical protein
MLEGEGLIGSPVFQLGPGSSGSYDILFSPITPGKQKGSVTFVNDKVGEFWYELELVAQPSPPVSLPHLSAAVGYKAVHTLSLENPIGEEVCVCMRVVCCRIVLFLRCCFPPVRMLLLSCPVLSCHFVVDIAFIHRELLPSRRCLSNRW